MTMECPEVDEYRNNPWGMSAARLDGVGSGGYVSFTPKILADAAIAALEARVANLEAELAFSQDQRIASIDRLNGQTDRAEQAEAELAKTRAVILPQRWTRREAP